jgi:hypothetical protein
MRHSFELRLSTDPPYRALAADVAGRFVELAGGAAAEATAFGADVGAAVEALAPGVPSLDLAFRANGDGVEVAIDAAGRSRVVRRRLPTGKD